MRKQTLTKGLMILALTGPAVTNFSCVATFGGDLREAVTGATVSFVEQATLDLLQEFLGSLIPDTTE